MTLHAVFPWRSLLGNVRPGIVYYPRIVWEATGVLPSVVPNWIQRIIHRQGVTVVIFLSGRAGRPSMPSFLGDLYSAMCGKELCIIHGLFGKRLSSFSPVGRPPMHGMEAKAAGNGGQRLTSSSPRQCPARTPTECPARAQYVYHPLIGRAAVVVCLFGGASSHTRHG